MIAANSKSPSPLSRSQTAAFSYWRVQTFFSGWLGYFGYYLCRKNVPSGHAWTLQIGHYSTLIFAFSLAYVIGQWVAGSVVDRIGGRVPGLVGALLSAACTVGMLFAHSSSALIALQIGNGLAQGCGYPAICKMFGAWFCRQERGIVFAWWSTSYSLGGFLATVLRAWLSTDGIFSASFKLTLWVPAALLVLIAIYFFLRTRNSPEDIGLQFADNAESTPGPVTWMSILRNRDIQILAAMYFFLKLTRYALLLWLPIYLAQSLKYSEQSAGYTASLFELAGFAGMLLTGYVSDRLLGYRRYPIGTVLLFALAFVCLLHPVLSGLGWWATAVSICLMGMLIYGPDVLMTATTVLESVPARGHGRAAALVNGVGSLGQMVSPLIVSAFVQSFGWDSIFNLFVICAVLGGALLALRWDKERIVDAPDSYTLRTSLPFVDAARSIGAS